MELMDEEDYQAKDAVKTLFRAEEIKDKPSDFLQRVQAQISMKIDLLERVRAQLPQVGPEIVDITDGAPEKGTRRFEDFLDRMRAKEQEEEARMFESPALRRATRKFRQSIK